MKKINALSIISVSLFTAGVNATVPEEQQIGYQSPLASEAIQKVIDDSNIVYINMNDWLNSTTLEAYDARYALQYSKIKNDILKNDKRYFIDFSDISEASKKQKARNTIKRIFGLTFPNNAILITKYREKLTFSPIDTADSPLVSELDSINTDFFSRAAALSAVPQPATLASTAILPIKTYFIKVVKSISSSECEFPSSTLFPSQLINICGNNNVSPHITLNYKISYMRSKPAYGPSGTTPDQKLVRISLDSDAGAGILLNDIFRKEYTSSAGYTVLDGWITEFLSSGIAQNYDFTVAANNNTASILQTFPRNSLNKNYSTTDINGYSIGATAQANASVKDGASASIGVSISYEQQRRFTFNTSDYKVIRTPYSGQKIGFKWEREQYATAASLQKFSTTDSLQFPYPVDTTRVNEIGYRGFVPNFDVIFGAAPTASGTTSFNLEASVGIKPTYNRIYRHYYVIGSHHSYHGHDVAARKVSISQSFSVDWGSAVFTGGFPVNLQLGGTLNNSCLNVSPNGIVDVMTCDITSNSQSFIFDNQRYISVTKPTLCLDSSQITQLSRCDSRISQKWNWDDNNSGIFTTVLRSINAGNIVALTHNTNGALTTAPVVSGNANQQTLTSFTTLW